MEALRDGCILSREKDLIGRYWLFISVLQFIAQGRRKWCTRLAVGDERVASAKRENHITKFGWLQRKFFSMVRKFRTTVYHISNLSKWAGTCLTFLSSGNTERMGLDYRPYIQLLMKTSHWVSDLTWMIQRKKAIKGLLLELALRRMWSPFFSLRHKLNYYWLSRLQFMQWLHGSAVEVL